MSVSVFLLLSGSLISSLSVLSKLYFFRFGFEVACKEDFFLYRVISFSALNCTFFGAFMNSDHFSLFIGFIIAQPPPAILAAVRVNNQLIIY